jgi:xanthine dehydrogenase accessory factor
MSELTVQHIDKVLAEQNRFYFVQVLEAKGSTPRNAGAMMIVGRDEIYGTIGGGSAEWVAIMAARGFIDGAEFIERQIITLGPEIDQCCGGTLDVSYRLVDKNLREEVLLSIDKKNPVSVFIFGAGHTGLALANALSQIGEVAFKVQIIDTRTEYEQTITGHNFRCLAVPEEVVRNAPKGAVFIITTHDHSLDFLITAEALARGDAKYVGMIGSKTKRAVLKSWMGESDYDPKSSEKLHCPIGGTGVKRKQPEIIAVMTVAEILTALE